MSDNNRTYVAIDLKSFYASVECMERNLDPLTTNLVVADESRTEKTICLAVSPSLKAYGIPGRARLFEVVQKVKEVNAKRKTIINNENFKYISYDDNKIKVNPYIKVSYIAAPPRMAFYIDYSTRIYNIYLKYIAKEDIHVYSIDEVFMDVTNYLATYNMTAKELTRVMIEDVFKETGITATAGIGSNLYLSKIAMDVVAKHVKPDIHGVRIASLDEISYRKELWTHTPITDFWRVGRGYAKRLSKLGIYNMGDIARCSIGRKNEFYNEDLLYKTFGINAELLIDHAWGYESCTIKDIKDYKPRTNSISHGQVLTEPYDYNKARLVLKEMTELMSLDLVVKGYVTNNIALYISYDIINLTINDIIKNYKGEIATDGYGRKVPKSVNKSITLKQYTASTLILRKEMLDLFDTIVNKKLYIRKLNMSANNLLHYESKENNENNKQNTKQEYIQLDLFKDYGEYSKKEKQKQIELEKERNLQKAVIEIKKKYGKNAMLKGMDLQEGATTKQRNTQIGGHKQ